MKKILLGFVVLFGAGSAFAGPPTPVIHPSTAAVQVGGSLTITSTNTITCSLVAGSSGTLAGCIYTAPASLQAKNIMDGCMLMPNDSVYNTDISSLSVDANSASRVAAMSTLFGGASVYIQMDVAFPHNVYNNSTPQQNIVSHFTTNNDGPYPVWPFPYMGAEASAVPADSSRDQHILGVSTSTCRFSELYGFYAIGFSPDCPTCNTGSGVQYDGSSYNLPDTAGGNSGGGVDAAGAYLEPLAMRYSELKAGVINHAMRFTMPNGLIQSAFVWPGVANATPGCTPSSACIPYGSRWRLKANYDISSYSATTQVILRALKKYGMFMNDGGSAMHIQSMNDVFQDTTTYQAIQSEIRFGTVASYFNFEQVNESSLMVSTASAQVAYPNASNTIPTNFAIVVASDTVNHSTATLRIALVPVTVGTYNIPFKPNGGAMSVMSGMPQFQIPYWVEGANTTTATCSMSPTLGSLTSDCLYTAPALGVTAASTTIVTITPVADSTNAINFPLTVLSSDAIRVVPAGLSGIGSLPHDSVGNYGPDATGHYWATNATGMGVGWSTKQDGAFPTNLWVSSNTFADVGLYYSYWPGISDGAFSAMVPNGNYVLQTGYAIGDPGGSGISAIGQSLDTQGTTVISTTAFKSAFKGVNYTTYTITTPVQVTNNQFYFSLRDVQASSATMINNFSLTFSSGLFPAPVAQSEAWIGGIKMQGSNFK